MLRFRRIPLAALVIAAGILVAGCGGDSKDESFAACKDVPYSDQAFDGAFNVKAQLAGCDLAQSVAAAGRSVDTGAENVGYTVSGFNCTAVLQQHDGRPGFDYTCKNAADGAVVKFTRY